MKLFHEEEEKKPLTKDQELVMEKFKQVFNVKDSSEDEEENLGIPEYPSYTVTGGYHPTKPYYNHFVPPPGTGVIPSSSFASPYQVTGQFAQQHQSFASPYQVTG